MLQRMHQLVRDHEAGLAGIDVGGNVQGVRVGVEVARHLLGEQVDHAAPQVERIRDEAEQAVGGLRARELDLRRSIDRKSTRLKFSHVESSYAVYGLKKKSLYLLVKRRMF